MSDGWDRVKFGEVVIDRIMTDNQVTREVAITHIASFVKKYVPVEEHEVVDRFAADEFPRLLVIMANIYTEKLNCNQEAGAILKEIEHS